MDIEENFLLSGFLSSKLHKDYSLLSKTFSQRKDITLEQFFILQKIEKVKELLLYNEFTLTEIAGKNGSVADIKHFSNCPETHRAKASLLCSMLLHPIYFQH